ncbi:hypothetical protein CPC08DRAFT_715173 [Agrocybe pediades]|nr:hypothetical protein CPC08DRAFT_715173 [Agrocybe pediades]
MNSTHCFVCHHRRSALLPGLFLSSPRCADSDQELRARFEMKWVGVEKDLERCRKEVAHINIEER